MQDRASGATSSARLDSLEALRAAAAVMVVLFHTQFIVARLSGLTPFHDVFRAGDRGVDLFFVLSGFIIAHRHGADGGHPRRLLRYLAKRACRIYPLVWAMTALAIALYAFGFGDPGKAAKLSASSMLTSALLVPHRGTPLVNVTWSLQYEMVFYVLFGAFILSRRLGAWLLASWQLMTAAALLLPVGLIPLDPVCLDFGAGLACALLLRRPMMRPLPTAALLSLAAGAVALFLAGMAWKGSFAQSGLVCAGASAALIVALVRLEHRIRVPAWLAGLGGASYAIYMVHYSVVTLAASVAARVGLPLTDGIAVLLALGGIAAGCAVDRWLDQPVQRWLRARTQSAPLPSRPAPDAALAACR